MRSRTVRWGGGKSTRAYARWLARKGKVTTEVQSEHPSHVLSIAIEKDSSGKRRHILPPDLPDVDDIEADDDGSHEARADQDRKA